MYELNQSSATPRCSLKELRWSDPKTGDGTAGNQAFSRFRNTHLRKKRVPDDVIQCWLGHAGKSMTDEFSQVRDDLKYRKLVAEQVGLDLNFRLKHPQLYRMYRKADLQPKLKLL
jgi:integrase